MNPSRTMKWFLVFHTSQQAVIVIVTGICAGKRVHQWYLQRQLDARISVLFVLRACEIKDVIDEP